MLNDKYTPRDKFCKPNDLTLLIYIPSRFHKSTRQDICTVLGVLYIDEPDHDPTTHKLVGPTLDPDQPVVHYSLQALTAVEITLISDHSLALDLDQALTEIKGARQSYLDKLVKSSGVAEVYEANLLAVGLWEDSRGSEVVATTPEGSQITALAYLTDLATADGKTVEQFCVYVRTEEAISRELGRQIEIGYLNHKRQAYDSDQPLTVAETYRVALVALSQGVII